MKNYLVLLLFLTVRLLVAQDYVPFLQDDKVWLYEYDCSPSCGVYSSTVKYFIEGDTIIDTREYKKIYGEILSYNPDVWGERDEVYLAALLSEDTVEEKVYMYYGLDVYADMDIYNTGQVLFDFSFEEGDSLYSYTSNLSDTTIFVIDSIRTGTLLDGSEVREYYSSNNTYYGIGTAVYTEGIGSEVINIDMSWTNAGYSFAITCVIDDNVDLKDGNCTALDIETVTIDEQLFKLYPSLCVEEFIVDALFDAEIYLFDIEGNVLLSMPVLSGENRYSCSSLKSGIYFYKIQCEDCVSEGRIIKK